MTDSIGAASIALTADSSKLKAGVEDAKKSIKSLGKDVSGTMQEATGKASRSIDNYIKKLQTTAATNGKSARETELYALALRGASKAQLDAADSALRMSEGYEKGVRVGQILKTGFIALAAAASAAAIATVSSSIALLDSLDDLAEKSGLSVEAISKLRYAGEVAGTSFDSLKTGLTKLSKQMAEAAGGNKEAIATFEALGVSVTDTDGKLRSSDEVLTDLASRFAGYEDGAAKAALAQRVFGKSGEALIPLLNLGGNGLERMRKEATQLGAIYGGDLAANAATFGDNLTRIKLASEGAAISISGGLIKSLANLSTEFLEARKNGGLFAAGMESYVSGVKAFWSGTLFNGQAAAKSTEQIQAYVNKMNAVNAGGGRGFINPKVAAPVVKEPEPKGPKPPKAPKDNSAEQEAKARLAFDLDQIKNASSAILDTIANSEKILEAKRSASLNSEAEYYAEKRRLLVQNNGEQEAAAQKEIDRLQAEVLTGKDKIDNDRKIADSQAKLNKLREAGATNLKVLDIKESEALENIKRAFVDAENAAQSYLDVITRAAQAEIAGIGKGQKARELAGGISSIEEKFAAQRQDLQRDNRNGKFAGRSEDYQRELALLNSSQAAEIAIYQAKYKKLGELQKDWTNGATEALTNYYEESQNIAKQTEEAFTSAFRGIEDALVEFVKTGKLDFKSLINSIMADVARMAIKQSITGPLSQLLSGAIGSVGSGGGYSAADQAGLDGLIKGLAGRAIGGPVSAGGMYRVNERGPELLAVAGKQYLMMGGQPGDVRPMQAAREDRSTVVNNFALQGKVDRRTEIQLAQGAASSIRRARRFS